MDDAIQPGLGGDFKLLLEKFRLPLFVTRVVGWTATGLATGQMVVIQADFTDRDNFGVPGKLTQGRAQVGRRFHRLGRMPADGDEDIRELFSKAHGAFTAAQARADGNYFGDAGGLRAGDDLRQILFVIGKIEVRVGVVKRRHEDRVER